MEEQLIDEIFTRMNAKGFGKGTEQYEICKRALQFRKFSYKRSEELEAGTVVDCSTLVSQAHWEGAVIGVPFIAESQRKAVSGKTIESRQDMIPGDVLIKYSSLDASPDKTWNHVGLYLGRDAKGEQWLIESTESTSQTGVRLSTVDTFDPQGGIKRFTLSTQAFTNQEALQALSLAPLVPKFGRLGVRQYRKSGGERLAHKGVDLYVPTGTAVYATVAGTIELIHESIENMDGIAIASQEVTVRFLMLNGIRFKTGDKVEVGELLGYVVIPSERSDIVYSSAKEETSHLHLEVEARTTESEWIQVVIGDTKYLNHLYLSKAGKLALPFRI